MNEAPPKTSWMPTNFQPGLVSVIIPTFNNAHLIGETVQSVFLQTHRPLEVIFVDDGSTDSTRDTVDEFREKYSSDPAFEIRYFFQGNKGGAIARNLGITKSRGEYIQFLDSDDLLSENKIALQMDAQKNLPEKTTAYGSWRYFEKHETSYRLYKLYDERKTENQLLNWISGWFVPSHAILWRRSDIATLGPWDESLKADQDGEYALRFLMAGGSFAFVENNTAYYRQSRNLKKVKSTVSRQATAESIQSRIGLVQQLETQFTQQKRLDADTRNALARRYYEIARHWTLHQKELRQFCLKEFARLTSNGAISASLHHRALHALFGFAFTQKLKFVVRNIVGVPRQFRSQKVNSLEELCRL